MANQPKHPKRAAQGPHRTTGQGVAAAAADRDWAAFDRHVRQELYPMVESAAVYLGIWPTDGKPDVKFAIELGAALCFGKPLIMALCAGEQRSDLPAGLLRAIEASGGEVVEHVDVTTDVGTASLRRAITAMVGRVKEGTDD